MAWTASFNRTDTYIDLETDISLNDFSITFENVIFNIATPSGQSQVLSGSQNSFNYAIGIVPDQWFVRIAGTYYYFDFTSIGDPTNNRGTFTVTRTGDQLTADFNGSSETVTSTTLPMFFGGFGLFNMSFVTSVHVPDGEIGDTTLNDGTSDIHKWDYTNSNHNSGTDPVTNPFTVTDSIGSIDGTGINMTDANWIDLGGAGNEAQIDFSLPSPAFSVTADNVAPENNASVDFDIPAPTFSITADNIQPGNSASVNFDIVSPQFSVTADNFAPVNEAAVSVEIPVPQFSVTASNVSPGNSAFIDFDISAPVFSVTAENESPELNQAEIDFTVSAPQFSVSADNTAPINQAEVSFELPAPVFSTPVTNIAVSDKAMIDIIVPTGIIDYTVPSGIIDI